MISEKVQALNYTSAAIRDLKDAERGLLDQAPYTAYVLRQVIDLLDKSVKFILPNCCDIIAPEDYRQSHLDLARLPYPVVTFEAPWVKEEEDREVNGFASLKSSRRIALCWESDPDIEPVPGCNAILKRAPEGGVFILPISFDDSNERWVMGQGGVFFPHENSLRKIADFESELPASKIAMETRKVAGKLTSKMHRFYAEPFIAWPDFKDEMAENAGGIERLYAQVIMDTHDEVQTFIQACSVLNCENVTTVTLSGKQEKKFVNGRRVKPVDKETLPAYTYKILQLNDEKTAPGDSGSGSKGGSKRMHLRRGHLRRLAERVIWVRPSMINAHSQTGFVDKDYAINVSPRKST